jgi:uncharacterized membrane protein
MSYYQTANHAASDAVDFHRDAYNAAFYELGLKWHWDETVYEHVLSDRQERERLLAYLNTHQTHLLSAYDAEFLVAAIETTKARWYDALLQSGASRRVNWAEFQQAQVGA